MISFYKPDGTLCYAHGPIRKLVTRPGIEMPQASKSWLVKVLGKKRAVQIKRALPTRGQAIAGTAAVGAVGAGAFVGGKEAEKRRIRKILGYSEHYVAGIPVVRNVATGLGRAVAKKVPKKKLGIAKKAALGVGGIAVGTGLLGSSLVGLAKTKVGKLAAAGTIGYVVGKKVTERRYEGVEETVHYSVTAWQLGSQHGKEEASGKKSPPGALKLAMLTKLHGNAYVMGRQHALTSQGLSGGTNAEASFTERLVDIIKSVLGGSDD